MRTSMSLVVALLGAPLLAADPVVLSDVLALPEQRVACEQSVTLTLPPLPAQAGKVLVLSFRAFVLSDGPGGCNWNGIVSVNDTGLGRFTSAGTERLIGRAPQLELRNGNLGFSVTSGERLMVMFARDANEADSMTKDDLGGTFLLDIGDVARGVDGNALTFGNAFRAAGDRPLVVQDLRLGYLDRAALPVAVSHLPTRGPVASAVSVGGLRLSQGRRGGFVLTADGGPDLLVETGLGMNPDAPSALLAEDDGAEAIPAPAPEVRVTADGPAGFRLEAVWPGLRLQRTLALADGLLHWRETWTNTGDATRGVPLRHRLFLRDGEARFHVGGSTDNIDLAGSAANPTLYLEPAGGAGAGYGLTVESDWWRLLHGLRGLGGLGEVYTTCLALAAGASLDLEMTLTPVPPASGGYWHFINALRRRWGVNGLTMARPMFWHYARRPGVPAGVEQMRASLGNLGPITVVLGPWQRLEPDARVVRAGRYPKLPAAAPRTPGACPDLDVDAFLTFAHREAYWESLMAEAAALREAVPGIQVIQMTHPAMECVYRPLESRWPIAADAIRTSTGEIFADSHYTAAWVGAEMAAKDWAVLYYVPRPDSAQMRAFISGAERAMDQGALDGMYSDEFSWAFVGRRYSRYDYSRWDGYSADLGPEGQVVALKTDHGMVTEACQLAMIEACRSRGKFFLANGGSCLRRVQEQPHHRFIEGGNGPSWSGQGHLSAVPLILGNMGDRSSAAGVFDSVRQCLAYGSLYSPVSINLLLDGPDNFVCRLYPMTVREIGPGVVVGEERLIASATRTVPWPPRAGTVRVYRYDREGALLPMAPDRAVAAGEAFTLEVPEAGLAIAELR